MFETKNILQAQANILLQEQAQLAGSQGLIIQKYNGYKSTYAKRYRDSGAEKILKDLTGNEQNGELLAGQEIQTALNSIRSGNIYKYLKKNKTKSMLVSTTELNKIKTQWEDILKLFETTDGQFDEKRYGAVKTQYETLQKYINALAQRVNAKTENVDLKKILDKVKTHNSSGSTASAVNGLLNGLVGEKLEAELTQELNSRFNNKNQVAIKTGSAKNISGKSIKTDIYSIMADTEFEIGGTKYQFTSKGDILVNGVKEDKVAITSEVEKILLKKSAIGFSVKASNKAIVFHSGYSLSDWISKNKNSSIYYDRLLSFYENGVPNGINPGYWERIILASDLQNIIGHNNLFIVSSKKIIPTFKYLEQIGRKYQTQLHFSPAIAIKGGRAQTGSITSRKVVGGAL